MTTSAARLMREYQSLQKTSGQDEDIKCVPVDESSLNVWRATIRGPEDSPFEGYSFTAELRIPSDYPMAPPQAVFITKLFHPNVHFKTGAICLDILKRESWVPAWGIASVCRALQALLSSPEADSPLNCDAGNMIRANDLRAYRSMAKMYAELYANKLDIKTRLSGNSPNTSN